MKDIADKGFRLGVVGAGAMGAGIAQVAAQNGIALSLYDARDGGATQAKAGIAKRLDRLVEKGKIDAAAREAAEDRIEVAERLDALAPCSVVIEAIVEDLDAKAGLFAELERYVAKDAILATNTSSLPVGAIAARLEHKARVAGLHFFNPVPLMRLVEVIPGPDTSDDVLSLLTGLARRMGREPVQVTDTPGFLVNFGGRAYSTEALAILQERVARPEQIDAVMRDCFGFRMGPFELLDLTGMDVNFPVTEFVHRSMFGDPRLRSTARHKYMLDTGQLGRKTGRGFYAHHGQTEPAAPGAARAVPPAARVVVPDGTPMPADLVHACGGRVLAEDDGASPVLVTLTGEDCAAHAARTGRDFRRLVALDPLGDTSTRVTLMSPPCARQDIVDGVAALLSSERAVTVISDSPGFIGQRIAAMVCNLGCEMAQMGLAEPEAIDTAMRLGLNYPQGPLEMTDTLGVETVFAVMSQLQTLTGDDRYRPSQWLRRRAQLGLRARAA
ncbi:3-hydroxyacyl-CoA dehydrogenase [Roseovarius salis]|uniref:3-hydroxyacyl-CoA dehydrogenase n=1 Tax=Roseovarius salis TaxID=3376063 RepID=UPI0037C9230E